MRCAAAGSRRRTRFVAAAHLRRARRTKRLNKQLACCAHVGITKTDRPAGRSVLISTQMSLRLVAVDLLEQAGLLGRWLVLLIAPSRGLGLLGLAGLQALHKAIDLAGGVHDPLLAGVERMAVRADIDAHVL